MDIKSKDERSFNMLKIRSKDTKIELIVREYIHAKGMRYSLHSQKLPGKPDIVLRRYMTVIFVNGCFFHHHQNCKYATIPEENRKFWIEKFKKNEERDKKKTLELKSMGWKVLTVWECQLKSRVREKTLNKLIDKIIT